MEETKIRDRRSKIAGIAMVKNEQDIIEPFVRHNIRFLDRLMILDNGSVDDTRLILRKLAAELPTLTVINDDSFGYTQSERMTLLLNGSQTFFPADFVVFLDADEFINIPGETSFDSELARIPSGGFGLIAWTTFVLTPQIINSTEYEEDPLRAMTWRRRVEWEPFYKAIIRLDGNSAEGVVIAQGNHYVMSAGGAVLKNILLPELKLYHYPVRNRKQLISKTVVGWMAYLAKDPLAICSNAGFQWRDTFERIAKGETIDDNTLCESSILYAQSQRAINMEKDIIQDLAGNPENPEKGLVVYERRYSSGLSMDVLQLIARSWHQSIVGPATKVAERLSNAGCTKEAISYLEAAIKQDETADLWNAWATLKHKCGAVKDAEQGFRHALKLDEANRDAAVNLGFVLFSQGRIKEGLPLFQQHEQTLTEEEKKAMSRFAEQWRPQDASPELQVDMVSRDAYGASLSSSSTSLNTKMIKPDQHLIILYYNQGYFEHSRLLASYLQRFGEVVIYGGIQYKDYVRHTDLPVILIDGCWNTYNYRHFKPNSGGHFGYRAWIHAYENRTKQYDRITLVQDDTVILPKGWEWVLSEITNISYGLQHKKYSDDKYYELNGKRYLWEWFVHPTVSHILDEPEVWWSGYSGDFYSITKTDCNEFYAQLKYMSERNVFLEVAVPTAFGRSGIFHKRIEESMYKNALKLSQPDARKEFYEICNI